MLHHRDSELGTDVPATAVGPLLVACQMAGYVAMAGTANG